MSAEILKLKAKCPANWDVLTFCDAIKDATAGNPKIKKGAYKQNGSLAVIDQGQELIGGYIEDESQACKEQLPCILFGDHTKIFKFIDQPFALGADGVKVLVPKGEFDKRFLYHYLNTLKLPDDAGYSRHYKFLKEKAVVKPPLAEQKRIATILDKADAIRRKRHRAIQLADEFLQSMFLDLFGPPVLNPKKWDVFPLGSLIKTPFQNGAYFPKDRYLAHGVEMVHMSDAFYGVVKRGKLKRVDATKSEIKKYCLTTNDLLISRRSLNYEGAAKPCRIPKSAEPLIFESSLIRINPDTNKITPEYLYYYLSEPNVRKHYIFKYVSQSTISGINQNALKQIKIITPPLDLQYQFENTLLKIRYKIEKDETLRKEAADLSHSLTQRAFRGEL